MKGELRADRFQFIHHQICVRKVGARICVGWLCTPRQTLRPVLSEYISQSQHWRQIPSEGYFEFVGCFSTHLLPSHPKSKVSRHTRNYSLTANVKINTSANYALNTTHPEACTEPLHVSAPGCHHQGVIQSKGVQGQQLI
jgi:hypothetical protein